MPSAHLLGIAVLTAVHVAVIVRALSVDDRDPYSRAAWVLLLMLLPGIGAAAYLLFGEPWLARRLLRRARTIARRLDPLGASDAPSALETIPDRFRATFRSCERLNRWAVAAGNRATLAADSDAAIDTIVRDIDAAQATVHLSFYIWLTDHNGLKVVEALKRAAARGVTCRVIVDAIGSRPLTRSPHWRAMRDAGVRTCASLRAPLGLAFIAGNRIDLRNHRKIVVVDGRVTHCGSQNCADPAFLVKAKFAPWVDVMLRFEGGVVRQNQLLFAGDWMEETGEDLSSLFADPGPPPAADGFPAIAFGTGPMSPKGSMSEVFTGLLYGAEREVVVSTPYFVPDPPLLAALVGCARRGVATHLIVPARNDSAIVGAISRATYPQLLAAGVAVFEFRGGLLHAKTVVADGIVALVGSANMDRRSLELNFENNVLLYSPAVAGEVRERQASYLAQSRPVTHEDLKHRSMLRRLGQNLLTILGPVF